MSAFDNVNYWHISEIPLGWSIGERVGAEKAMHGVGVQSNAQPHLKTHLRPIVPTTPNQAATEWLLVGDLSNVTDDDVVQVVADELQVNPVAVAAKLKITKYNQVGALQFLAANLFWDGGA